MIAELPEDRWREVRQASAPIALVGTTVHAHRGRPDEGDRLIGIFGDLEASADIQERAAYACGASRLLLMRGEVEEAANRARAAFAAREVLGMSSEPVKESFVIAMDAALERGDLDEAEELLAVVERLPPGRLPQFLRAQVSRFRARVAGVRADSAEAERRFTGAVALLREIGMPFYLAVTLLEHGEWLSSRSRAEEAEPLLAEAREIFEKLEAPPWLARCEQALAPQLEPA
jgi:ATP/maltotriose-dependent transcriptional regulator MalT